MHTPPTVALVGRTNVGKSTLFNRLLETQKAIVSEIAGTTRDRNEGDCLWRGKVIRMIDTGGLDVDEKDLIDQSIVKQTQLAIKQADVILFVLDIKSGTLPQDRKLASYLRNSKKPVIVVANKAEKVSERLSGSNAEFRFGGLREPVVISAVRGTGVGDLLDEIYNLLTEIGKPPVDPLDITGIKVAVIGKPNVGKSTLLNALIGADRFITSPIAHTTREPNDTLVTLDDKKYIFIDTAGMRKHAKMKKTGGLEQEAVRRNEAVVRTADVTLLVIDLTESIGTQEKVLAGFLKESNSGVIVIVNKWDLIKEKDVGTMNTYREYVAANLPFLAWAPVIFVSALSHQRVHTIFAEIDKVNENRSKSLQNEDLDAFLRESMKIHPPSKGTGPFIPKLMGIKQVGTNPPVFNLTIKAKRTDSINTSYVRFLEKRLRVKFDFTGSPIHIHIKLATAVAD